MKTDKFLVCLIGKSVQYFEDAENAVHFASQNLYASFKTLTDAVDLLNAGKLAQWAYGFNEVVIYPPGVEIR